jgi:hypothetical protein
MSYFLINICIISKPYQGISFCELIIDLLLTLYGNFNRKSTESQQKVTGRYKENPSLVRGKYEPE